MHHSAYAADNPLKHNGQDTLNVGQFDSFLHPPVSHMYLVILANRALTGPLGGFLLPE